MLWRLTGGSFAFRNCQTLKASPAEPGGLPIGLAGFPAGLTVIAPLSDDASERFKPAENDQGMPSDSDSGPMTDEGREASA